MSRWFIYRRLHSLVGLGLILFLIEHLFINSQAAVAISEGTSPYIVAVNHLQNLPLLPVLEVLLLGTPFLIHIVLGVVYLKTGRYGFAAHDGSGPVTPYMNHYAYMAQRWTAWIVLVGLVIHVVQMRFLERPNEKIVEGKTRYEVSLLADPSLERLTSDLASVSVSPVYTDSRYEMVNVETKDFGTAELLLMRETFRSPGWMILYTLFMLSAVYHAFQGLWTFLLSWGVIISPQSQRFFHALSMVLMCFVAAMGLVAIYGTYWMHGPSLLAGLQ